MSCRRPIRDKGYMTSVGRHQYHAMRYHLIKGGKVVVPSVSRRPVPTLTCRVSGDDENAAEGLRTRQAYMCFRAIVRDEALGIV